MTALKPGWLKDQTEKSAQHNAIRRNVPAVVAALKAADKLAMQFTDHSHGDEVRWWCKACSSTMPFRERDIEHMKNCPVGRYLAVRKEIKNV